MCLVDFNTWKILLCAETANFIVGLQTVQLFTNVLEQLDKFEQYRSTEKLNRKIEWMNIEQINIINVLTHDEKQGQEVNGLHSLCQVWIKFEIMGDVLRDEQRDNL